MESAVASPGQSTVVAATAALSARQLGYRYGQRLTLHDLSLDVRPGEIVGVVGPNGAGKSTLLRLCAGLAGPSAGSLSWFGSATLSRPDRQRIGYLPDQAALFDELTGLENLQLLAHVRGNTFPAAALQALGVSLGLTEAQLGTRAGTYSFGMRRKVAIAQALTGDPALLLLDEPTLGLDASARDLLGQGLRGRVPRSAILLASNDLPFVQDYCDRVVFLAAGATVLQGRPDELLQPLRDLAGFRVTLREPYRPIQLAGVEEQRIDDRTLHFRSNLGTTLLAALVDALQRAGNDIENIGVRRADLSDVFRRVTGAEWEVT